jgi:hypothetical protein
MRNDENYMSPGGNSPMAFHLGFLGYQQLTTGKKEFLPPVNKSRN